jgi:transposase
LPELRRDGRACALGDRQGAPDDELPGVPGPLGEAGGVSDTAITFNTTWENVCRSVKRAVLWGVAHRDLSTIEVIGVGEIQWRSGHTYLTLVYQITGCKRLLWGSHERTEQSLRRFFELLPDDVRTGIRFVRSDMWRPYLNVIAEQIPQALHILDRFHIMRNMNVAIDEVRRRKVAQLHRDRYEPALTKSRWCLRRREKSGLEHG